MKPDLSLPFSHRNRTWIPYFVLLLTLLLTTFATQYVARTAKVKEQLRFERAVQSTQEKIENRLDTYITLLRATSGLFAADDSVSRDQFRAFVNPLRLQDRYPGIQGIGFSVRVAPQEVSALVANMQTTGIENFTITPKFPRNEYHSILYLEPLNQRNQAAIGFDMFTESVRRAAMERARDTGAPAASGKVTLVQEIDEQKQAGFLVYVPIYRYGKIPNTLNERRAMLTGFAYSPFRADDLMAGILGTEKQPTVDFEIYDSTVTPENLLHRSHPDRKVGASYQPRFRTTSNINIAGRSWRIAFASHPQFDRSSEENLVPYVFFSGVVVSLVLFGVTRSQARAKDAAEQVAANLRSSEQALRQSEERYRAFIEQSSEGIWRFEMKEPISIHLSEDEQIKLFYQYGYLAECNNVMAQMYGYSCAEEIVGVRLAELLIDSDPNNIEYLRSFIRSGYRLNAAESHEVDKHGAAKYFLNSLVGIIENGVLVRAWGTQVDITQRKQLEDALRQKSIEREVLLNSIPALVYYKDRDSKYIAVNRTFAETVNTSIDEIPGKTDFDLFPREQAAAYRKDDCEVIESGDRKWHIEEPVTGADGRTMWVATYKTAYRDSHGEITGLVGITIDITERKQIEEALRERETRYRLVARATNDAIWDWDLNTNKLEWNEGVETLFGYWTSDVGADVNWWYEHIHPDDRERVVSSIHEVIDSGGQIWTDEYRYLRADNTYALVIDRGLIAHDEQGKPVRMIGSMMDISARKQMEAQLRLSEARFRMLMDNVQDYAIFLLDTNARVVQWSAGAGKILGYQEAGILNQPGSIIFTPEDLQRGADKEELNKAITEGQAEDERWHVRKDGSCFWASGIMTSLRNESGQLQGFAKILRDFTERKQAEEALRESDARLKFALDAAQLGNWDLDLVKKTTRRSLRHDQAFGYNFLLPDWNYEIFLNHVHPEDREFVDQKFQQTLVTGVDWEFECRVIWADRSIHWIWARGSIYPDLDGNPIRLLGAVKDITARKQAEEEREQLLASEQEARAEAEAANRMKDEFLATLSHELRTPLNAMSGWTNLLRTRKFDEKTTARALETIDRNTKSLAQLIEDVLDVSRIITGKLRLNMSLVELAPIIEAAIETVQPAADAKNIQINSILQSPIGSVWGDASRLQQVFWNLLSNAVKFTPKGGRVEIKLQMVDSRVQVEVSDTGQGIEPKFLPYVFERFRQADSTTTRSYGGLGLGLAIVRHLVELHGGSVRAESLGVGQGATFIVSLPLKAVRLDTRKLEQQKAVIEEVPVDSGRSLAGLKVLVVDDEPDARELLTTVLEEYGAQLITVATAEAALEAIKQLQPDVLISDIGMPQEDGYTLIRKVRALDANQGGQIPAVALTAYARAEDRTQALLAGFQQHVSKPVDPAQLAAVVASLAGRNGNI